MIDLAWLHIEQCSSGSCILTDASLLGLLARLALDEGPIVVDEVIKRQTGIDKLLDDPEALKRLPPEMLDV